MTKKMIFLSPLLFLAIFICSCARFIPTPIGKIKSDIRNFDGKTVMVYGEVKDASSLLVAKYFIIKDDTGEITVITDNPLPKIGQKVRVTGMVKEAFSVGPYSWTVIIEKGAEQKSTS